MTAKDGNLGHAFIAINHSEHLEDSQIYSFSTDSNDPSRPATGLDIIMQRDHIVFSFETFNLAEYVRIYQSHLDRTVRVHKLNVTSEEALQLEEILRGVDIQKINQEEQYHLFSNNCMTQVLKIINSVVDEPRRLETERPDSVFEIGNDGLIPFELIDSIYNDFPFHVNRVLSQGHPLSAGDSRDFFSDTLQRIRLLGAAFRHLSDLGTNCNLSSQVLEGLRAHFTLLAKSSDMDLNLQPVFELTSTCDHSESLKKAESVINYIRLLRELESR
ncbi:MAG: DUF4105 domain-containing protein [Pseudomonadota bacterium]